MDEEEERVAQEAAQQEEEALRLIGVQMVRYNARIITAPDQQLHAEEFITLPLENNIHQDNDAP